VHDVAASRDAVAVGAAWRYGAADAPWGYGLGAGVEP